MGDRVTRPAKCAHILARVVKPKPFIAGIHPLYMHNV